MRGFRVKAKSHGAKRCTPTPVASYPHPLPPLNPHPFPNGPLNCTCPIPIYATLLKRWYSHISLCNTPLLPFFWYTTPYPHCSPYLPFWQVIGPHFVSYMILKANGRLDINGLQSLCILPLLICCAHQRARFIKGKKHFIFCGQLKAPKPVLRECMDCKAMKPKEMFADGAWACLACQPDDCLEEDNGCASSLLKYICVYFFYSKYLDIPSNFSWKTCWHASLITYYIFWQTPNLYNLSCIS